MRLPPHSIPAAAALATLTLAACGNDAPPGGYSKPNPPPTATAAAAPTTPPLTRDDLAEVCNGKGESRAKPYSKESPANHTVAVMVRPDTKSTFSPRTNIDELDEFEPAKPEDTEIVACITLTAETKLTTCNYDSDSPAHYLDVNDATYEIAIREATTAKVLDTKTVHIPAKDFCPTFYRFHRERESTNPDSRPVLLQLVRPHILAPGGTAAPLKPPAPDAKVTETDLAKACFELPSRQSPPYVATKGSISPLIVFKRPDENQEFTKSYASGPLKNWATEDVSQVQLVGCITEKSRKKTKECKFDQEKPEHILELYSATYDLSVRELKTGKTLATKTVNVVDNVCPFVWRFSSLRDSTVASPDEEMGKLAKKFAEPK